MHLDLSQNDFTQHSMPTLCLYLKNASADKLKALILDRNSLYDGGLQLLAVGLFERYQQQEDRNHPHKHHSVVMPLQYLGLSDTKFTDHGFKYLMQRFEAIYLRNLSVQGSRGAVAGGDVEGMMDIDLSRNNISETSIRYLADILRKFQGFRSISLTGLGKMSQSGFVELARALKDNHSL